MKKVALFWISLGLMALTGCGRVALSLNGIVGTPKQFDSRQIIVALSEDVRTQWQAIHQDILERYDVQQVGKFPLKSIKVNCLVYRVSEMVDVDEVVRRLRTDERIELVQFNRVFDGLQGRSAAAYQELSYGPKQIHADRLQSNVTGKGVSVAVIDTGVDKGHVELKGHIDEAENFVEGGQATFDTDKHGTAVTGVIASQTNNGAGIDGIAPDAKIDVYKACWYGKENEKALCSSWTLAKAVDAAINKGVRVINLSLSGQEDELLKKLLIAADSRRITVIAAALETGSEPGFPASLPFVIPVVSSDPNGDYKIPRWRTGQAVLVAPGVEILTTMPGNNYDFLSGSSLAAASVSGVVALMLERNPNLSPESIKHTLVRTGRTKGDAAPQENERSPVLIDACRAINALGSEINCR